MAHISGEGDEGEESVTHMRGKGDVKEGSTPIRGREVILYIILLAFCSDRKIHFDWRNTISEVVGHAFLFVSYVLFCTVFFLHAFV